MTKVYPVATPSPAVAALKAHWLDNPALSACLTLQGKLAAIAAAKRGASPCEATYVAQGYALPEGLTWAGAQAERDGFDLGAHMVPLSRVGNTISWGTPIIDGAYLRHAGNVGGRA